MSFSQSGNRSAAILAAIFVVGSMVLFRQERSVGPVNPETTNATGLLPAEADEPDKEHHLPARVEPRLAMRLTSVQPGTRTEEIERVFPDLRENISNWREFHPERFTVAPLPDQPISFTRTVLKEDERYVTWIGRNPDLPGASLVTVATAAGFDAILVLPGAGEISYHVRGQQVVVTEFDPADETCGNTPPPKKKELNVEAAELYLGISYEPDYVPVPDSHVETTPNKVDVLIAYDADTLAAAARLSPNPESYIDAQFKARIETCNLMLTQSGVTAFAWRYLGAVPAPSYTRTGKTVDDLSALIPNGALGTWVSSIRFLRGADQFVLLIAGETDFGGRAYMQKQQAIIRDRALSVVHWGRSSQTLAHELAHNFGCAHDRAHVNVLAPDEYGEPAPDSDGYWSYGLLWDNPVTGGGTAGTVMSYANWRIPYFSNPNISVRVTGAQFGWSWDPDLGTHQIGRAETDPKAAYNAKVLNDQAQAMSILREEIVQPLIEQQPQGVSVVRGRHFFLEVKAVGGGLTYQWFKDGVALPESSTATYGKLAADADAGAYSVVVSNHVGNVTSASATVTITAPPPPSSGGGGGGGGGAPSLWFLGSLALSLAIRLLVARTDS